MPSFGKRLVAGDGHKSQQIRVQALYPLKARRYELDGRELTAPDQLSLIDSRKEGKIVRAYPV
jgi:hypothetical protein